MKRPSMWRWPVVIGVVSLVGLLSALMGDGWLDALSWVLLAVPVVLSVRGLFGRRKGS